MLSDDPIICDTAWLESLDYGLGLSAITDKQETTAGLRQTSHDQQQAVNAEGSD